MRVPHIVRALACLSVCAMALGCISCASPGHSGERADTRRQQAPGSVRPGVSNEQITGKEFRLPLDVYELTERQQGEIALARTLLAGYCMAKLGYEFQSDHAAAQAAWATRIGILDFGNYGNVRRYGVVSATEAAVDGYHLPSTVQGDDTPPFPSDRHGLGAPSAALNEALNGTMSGRDGIPPGGCMGEADRRLGLASSGVGGSNVGPSTVQQAADESFAASMKASRVNDAIGKWSECMKSRGYSYSSPISAAGSFKIQAAPVSAMERAVAVADVSCKAATHLTEIWFSVEKRYQEAQILQAEPVFNRLTTQNDNLIRKAESIVSDAGYGG